MPKLSNESLLSDRFVMDAPGEGRAGHPEFYYDPVAGRYRYRDSGQFVSQEAMENLTKGRIDQEQEEMDRRVDALIAGTITFLVFQLETIEGIKRLHTQQIILGRGGYAAMDDSDWLLLARELKDNQYRYFQQFMQDLKNGSLSEAQLRDRIKNYARTSRRSYEKGKRQARRTQGKKEERRRLGSCRHCEDCLQYAREGWQPVGSLPVPTDKCACLGNCCCTMEFR